MTTIEEKQYIINKIQDILNKIKVNHLANQKELEELQREYNDIIYQNSRVKKIRLLKLLVYQNLKKESIQK